MNVYSSLSLVILIAISVSFAFAQQEQLMLLTKTQSTFYDGDTPAITGKILDQSKKPVSDAIVQVQYPSEMIEVKTNPDGSFNAASTTPGIIGEYGVSIIVSKPGYVMAIIPVEYSVIEKPAQAPTTNATNPDVAAIVADGFVNNPIAQILAKQMEDFQKQVSLVQNQTMPQNDTLAEQRKIAQNYLNLDLERMNKDMEYYNPFNAFSRFASDFDDSVRSIFWGEFEITQQQHKEGQKAKLAMLESGHSSAEATKAYQEKAKIGKDKIVELNNKINAKSGANNTSHVKTKT